MKQQQSGFTLVEIAIVLVIIGLLLGGILKGQELITNAKVRNIADQQNAIKAAYFAFQDRFRALPGDYAVADKNIPNVTTLPAGGGTLGDSRITNQEIVYAWFELANAGFISCSQCSGVGAPATPDTVGQNNSPVNAFNGAMSISYNADYSNQNGSVNNLKSGQQIPSNLLAEVDRKIDDGNPTTGALRFATKGVDGTTAIDATCLSGTDWQVQAPKADCMATTLF